MKTKVYSIRVFGALLAALTLFIVSERAPAQTYFGNALSFDGTNDYVEVPDGIWFSNNFTIEAWVYARSHGSWSRVLDFGNGAPRDNVSLAVSEATSGRPVLEVFFLSTEQRITAPHPIPTHQWVHLAGDGIGDGVDPVQVHATLSNLTAGAIYHYRVVASDASAPSFGAWSNTTGDAAGLPQDASPADLLQGLVPTYSPSPFFDYINGAASAGQSSLTDGSATATSATDANGAYLPETFAGGRLPCTVTFMLDTTLAASGYDLTQINSFAGWHENGRTLGNQKFEFQVRQAGGGAYFSLGTFEYLPFTVADGLGPSTSLLSLTNLGGGAVATNVDSVRFVFQDTGVPAPNNIDGFVIKELDVFGHPSAPVQTTSHNTVGDTSGLSQDASSADRLQGLTPTYSRNPFFDINNGASSSGLTDGSATVTSAGNPNGAYLPATFAGGSLPCTVTFQLNTNIAPAGYVLTQINSFAGWHENGRTLANQKFELQVRQVGGDYVSVGTFEYLPFTADDGIGTSTSLLSLSAGRGVLASHVDSVRFVFQATGVAAPNNIDGFVIKELDLFGYPVTPVQTTSQNTTGDTAGLSDAASDADLLQGLVPTYSPSPFFDYINGGAAPPGQSGLTDGSATATSATDANGAYLPETFAGGRLPCTVTFMLNTSLAPSGYDLTRINSFAGWWGNGRTLANQKFDLQVRHAGGDYISLGTFEYLPFDASDGTGRSSSLLSLTNPGGGAFATNVDSVRLVVQATGVVAPNDVDGYVIKELDVFGYPSAFGGVSLASPTPRQVIQRSQSNTADVHIRGNLGALTGVQRIEARAVIMAGPPNNGTTTDWITISTVSAGTFSAVLPAVAAGGWYRIEVRALNDVGEEVGSAAVEQVGVGDVFVTAGQSNAGCFGDPRQQPMDDRVSAWTVVGDFWQWAADPQPNPGNGGTGGSPWPILGTLLAQSNDVPVGFASVAWGGAALSQWQPGTEPYRNLTNALRAFGVNGVRAVLWHQGESDSLASNTALGYAQMLSNIVAQSRADAGWTVPWGIAEASFHPDATRAQEEPVAAGQRLFLYHNTRCFRGPRTDDFNLEGKLSDTVHFNAAGLQDHAQQWADAILGIEDLTIKNGDFEANQPLADGQSDDATRVIGWNRLDAAGAAVAGGNNGYFNAGPGTYSNSADGINGGVLPGMSGRHAGTLSGGAGGNAFLQTLPAHLQPNTAYTLAVALGVRDNADAFGGYRLDILANGTPLSPGVTGDLAALNALAGGNAAGKFTVVSNTFISGEHVATNQQLAVRLTRTGGVGTYLDFDDVRIVTAPRLSIRKNGDFYTLTWPGWATLQAADAVTGATWEDLYTGYGPYTDTPAPSRPQRYYRLSLP